MSTPHKIHAKSITLSGAARLGRSGQNMAVNMSGSSSAIPCMIAMPSREGEDGGEREMLRTKEGKKERCERERERKGRRRERQTMREGNIQEH